MINNEWERFGEEIRRTIQNAVDSRDYSRLNQTVSYTIGRAMDQVSRGLKNGGFWSGTMADYYELYAMTARAIKEADEAFRVGGPATSNNAYICEMREYCEKKRRSPRFHFHASLPHGRGARLRRGKQPQLFQRIFRAGQNR